MGKYMRKSKTAAVGAGEVAVMDVSQPALGVRTRARTLALKRLQKSPAASSSSPPPPPSYSGGYIQLRSRRLMKPPILAASADSRRIKPQSSKATPVRNPNPTPTSSARLRVASVDLGSVESVPVGDEPLRKEPVENPITTEARMDDENGDGKKRNGYDDDDAGVEASFGENVLDSEVRGRSTRESTPCSLVRDPDAIHTPGSTTKRPSTSSVASRGSQNPTRMHSIPTSYDMDQFFADAEQAQQRQFIEKYNFDPVSDKPLPGRYEWQKVEPKGLH